MARELVEAKLRHAWDIQDFVRQISSQSRLLAEQGHTIKDLRRRLRTVENVYKDTLRHYSAYRPPLNQLLHFLPIDEILELDLLDGRVNRVERKRSV